MSFETDVIFLMIIVVLMTVIIVILWVGSDALSLNFKIRFRRGFIMTIVHGKDRRISLDAVKVAGKETETQNIEINKNPYMFDPSKIELYKRVPVLEYYEGVPTPLQVEKGKDGKVNLGYGKLTPELLNTLIIIARQSGIMPKKEDILETLKTVAIFGACAGAIAGAYLIYNASGNLDKVAGTIGQIWTGVQAIGTHLLNTTAPRG